MKRWVTHGVRFVLVTVGIIVLTSLSIDATQYLSGSQSALGILARKSLESECPTGMIAVFTADGSFCIDIYENSVGASCPIATPAVALDSKTNIDTSTCNAESVADKTPWTSVTFLQAKELCIKRGARLPSTAEWLEAAIGTPDSLDVCNLDGSLLPTGRGSECISSRGIYDAVGNVWEWVDANVENGVYESRELPQQGYVVSVDHGGIATETGANPDVLMNEDYFWVNHEGVVSVMRGGFFGSKTDGGLYSVHAGIAPNFFSGAIGFRCVLEL